MPWGSSLALASLLAPRAGGIISVLPSILGLAEKIYAIMRRFSSYGRKQILHAPPLIFPEPDARSLLIEKFDARLLQDRHDPA
jgi:hypothetical protein